VGTFVIVDELEAPEPVTFEWWLHALEEMQIDRQKREVLIRRGDARLRATFVVPEELEFVETDKFDPPPENGAKNQWHLTGSTANKCRSATFIVVLSPYRAAEEGPQFERWTDGEGAGVRGTRGDDQLLLLYRKSGIRDIGDFGLETDGRILAFQVAGESPGSGLVVDTTKATDVAELLFQSTAPTTVACSHVAAGMQLVSDGPKCSIRLVVPEKPVAVRRDGRPVEFSLAEGMAGFDLPEGRATTEILLSELETEPQLAVVVDGKEARLTGALVGLTSGVWRQPYDGPDGQFRLTLPPGLKLIVGAKPAHGDTIKLRRGQTLWWYGDVPDEPVVLGRIDKAGDTGVVEKQDDVTATFSIVAVDPETRICGAAVASKYPAVGQVVPYVRAGVGAFCTQHWHNPDWGAKALDLLEQGKLPEEVLGELLRDDPKKDKRQLAIIDVHGRAANRNPANADPSGIYWGGTSGRYYACQGNTLTGREVITAMAKAYEETKGSLAHRLMAALVAGDRAGGDHRGRLAAGIRVAKPGADGCWLELQVDKSDDAVTELARKYQELEHPAKGE